MVLFGIAIYSVSHSIFHFLSHVQIILSLEVSIQLFFLLIYCFLVIVVLLFILRLPLLLLASIINLSLISFYIFSSP